jgi:glycosyltransferase involved in cell wall biosynthesis
MDRKVSTFMAVAEPQIKFLQQFLKLPGERAQFVWDQTDTRFFSPGPQSVDKSRPVIMSVGLEQRDYGTLATATADLDLDVNISGFSADTRVMSRAFPAEIPANMSRKFYPWPELQQLYRDADIVVVSLFPSQYAAGVQALMEALACARPVIVTGTEGLNAYLDHRDCVRVVPPGDPVQMRKAITELLNDPAARISMGQKALALAHERHPLEQYIHRIVATLKELAANTGR